MERRIAALVVVILLLGGVVTVQLLDPQFGEEDPPEVDFSEPPNEVAADAAKQFEYVDYAYRVDVKYGEKDEWRQYVITNVDHSNNSYRSAGPAGERETVIYGTSAAAFVRPSISEDWIVKGSPDVVYPVEYLTHPMHVERLREAEAHAVMEDSSTLTIYVDVNPAKIDGNVPGNATVVVNKSTAMVEKFHVTYNLNRTKTTYLRFRVTDTGTAVARPEGIGFSLREVIWDLLRGPLFRIEWLI